jgi:hypothetical protein
MGEVRVMSKPEKPPAELQQRQCECTVVTIHDRRDLPLITWGCEEEGLDMDREDCFTTKIQSRK